MFRYSYMPDYQEGKIYRIWDNTFTECYIGSTTESLSNRMARHRYVYARWKEGHGHFVSNFDMFDKYGLKNCKIELLEYYPCESKVELEAREGYHIRNNDCVNKCIPGRTRKEYRDTHKEKQKSYQAQYRLENKEQKKECDKVYRENNQDKIKEMKKQWYEQNKLRIAQKGSTKHDCQICGGKFTYTNKHVHEKSQRHQKALNQEPEPEN